MKRLLITMLLLGIPLLGISQTYFGVKGGPSFTFFNEDQQQFGMSPEVETGYFAGVFIDFEIDDSFHIQPELLYKGVGDFRFLNAPIYLVYDVGGNFSLLAGPSLNYFFDFFSNNFKVRADVSTAYHITERLDVNLKYSFGFEEISPNVLFVGLGYRL